MVEEGEEFFNFIGIVWVIHRLIILETFVVHHYHKIMHYHYHHRLFQKEESIISSYF